MKALKYAIISVLALAASGCTVTHNRAFAPAYRVSLEVHPSDVEYLGETEISVEYQSYLGFIRLIEKVNGEVYDRDTLNFSSFGGNGLDQVILSNHFLRRAAYKVFEEYPDATYYMVSREVVQRRRMFLSADVKAKATIRAYRLISK